MAVMRLVVADDILACKTDVSMQAVWSEDAEEQEEHKIEKEEAQENNQF